MWESSVCGGTSSAFLRHAEDLLKVQILPLVSQIHVFLRVIILLALDDRGQVRRGVERRSVGLDQDARRDLLRVRLLLHRHDQRALGFHAQALCLHGLEHLRDILLRVALAEPDVKARDLVVEAELQDVGRAVQPVDDQADGR